jgi:hypothetical protein
MKFVPPHHSYAPSLYPLQFGRFVGLSLPRIERREAIDRADVRLRYFLEETEIITQRFLSSRLDEVGITRLVLFSGDLTIADGACCRCPARLNAMPRLVWLFLRFLLRHHVLSEPGQEAGLRQALHVAELAMKELPLIPRILSTIPDELHIACREEWGRKDEGAFPGNPHTTGLPADGHARSR